MCAKRWPTAISDYIFSHRVNLETGAIIGFEALLRLAACSSRPHPA